MIVCLNPPNGDSPLALRGLPNARLELVADSSSLQEDDGRPRDFRALRMEINESFLAGIRELSCGREKCATAIKLATEIFALLQYGKNLKEELLKLQHPESENTKSAFFQQTKGLKPNSEELAVLRNKAIEALQNAGAANNLTITKFLSELKNVTTDISDHANRLNEVSLLTPEHAIVLSRLSSKIAKLSLESSSGGEFQNTILEAERTFTPYLKQLKTSLNDRLYTQAVATATALQESNTTSVSNEGWETSSIQFQLLKLITLVRCEEECRPNQNPLESETILKLVSLVANNYHSSKIEEVLNFLESQEILTAAETNRWTYRIEELLSSLTSESEQSFKGKDSPRVITISKSTAPKSFLEQWGEYPSLSLDDEILRNNFLDSFSAIEKLLAPVFQADSKMTTSILLFGFNACSEGERLSLPDIMRRVSVALRIFGCSEEVRFDAKKILLTLKDFGILDSDKSPPKYRLRTNFPADKPEWARTIHRIVRVLPPLPTLPIPREETPSRAALSA